VEKTRLKPPPEEELVRLVRGEMRRKAASRDNKELELELVGGNWVPPTEVT